MPRLADTIAALATPVGTAALAVVRASGPDTREIATELLGRPPRPRFAHHVDYRDRAGTLLDDVVLTFFAAPRSYTGENILEVSSHGNPFIAQRILEDLFHRGCRPAEPGEFTERAFLNGRMDLSQAEAVMDLIRARSDRALEAANQQLRGSLGRKINELIEGTLGVLARIEAYIDFPEEDLPSEDQEWVLGRLHDLRAQTEALLATAHYGTLLRDGIKTVIVGEPNVGKSSLLNRLVGRERALVSPEPGTTRDFIEERIVVGSHCLRLIDTAGLNPSPSPLERLGMEKTREKIAEADLVLIMFDSTKAQRGYMSEIAEIPEEKVVTILNKSDLLAESEIPVGSHPTDALPVSAKTGAGIERLTHAIQGRAEQWNRGQGEETIVVNARHVQALTETARSFSAAAEKVQACDAAELIAAEVRSGLSALGEVAGRVDNERMLDQLFASFCIGK